MSVRKPRVKCEGQFPNGCGANVDARPIRMNAYMVRILEFVAAAYPEPAATNDAAAALGPQAYALISKLKYFRLVTKARKPAGYEGKNRGWWLLTAYGQWFLEGLHEVPWIVWVLRNRVVRTEGGMVDVFKARGFHEEINRDTVAAEMEGADPDELDQALKDDPTPQGDEDDPDQ